MRKAWLVCLGVLALAAGVAAEDKETFSASCPISGKEAKKDAAAEVEGYTYYFCCTECPGAFKKDKEKYAAKGHYQLAETKQIVQKGCPFSGEKVTDGTKIKIGKAKIEVGFCCNDCKGKVEKAEDDSKKIDLVFKDISKGFKKAEK
jgi:YHS domain-containing protein